MFKNIPNSDTFKKIEQINKGWSNDKKYHIYTMNNEEYILRVSDISLYEKRKTQFDYLQELQKLNLPIPKPISFGKLNDKEIYMLVTYLEGVPASSYVRKASNKEAYRLGLEAGQILKKIHSIKIEEPTETWYQKYIIKMERKIKTIKECAYPFNKLDKILSFIENNIEVVKKSPYTFCHGDYHLGNMIINNNHVYIIDFDKCNLTDPIDDFKPFCWSVRENIYFETGLINAYFDNEVPLYFFKVLALYAAENLISHLPWAIKFGERETKTAFEVLEETLDFYDDFNLIIPKWYKGVINDNID